MFSVEAARIIWGLRVGQKKKVGDYLRDRKPPPNSPRDTLRGSEQIG
jgi:hypothetical protein